MNTEESMLWIREDLGLFWKDDIVMLDKGWAPHREISCKLGYQFDMINASEKNYGIYKWAPEFANVHSTFPYEEKPIQVDGEWFPHSEGYFQAMKAFGTKDYEKVKAQIDHADPMEAWSIGQRVIIRSDWESVKDEVMLKGVREKFKDPYLRDLLLSTGDYPLVQIKYCNYWGSGHDGKGKNMLGVILQQVREEIRKNI